MQEKSTHRNVTFEGDQQKFCALHKYGCHITNECLVLRNQNSVHCFKCGITGINRSSAQPLPTAGVSVTKLETEIFPSSSTGHYGNT